MVTTCAYCGVGCTFKAEMRGEEVVRMVPYKDGKANHGHSCVKGRFAWGYAHPPGPHPQADDPRQDHRSVARSELGRGDRATPRPSSSASRRSTASDSIGGITSSRCTNEETYLVQKLVRAGFGNNNVDTCARVCHSPTGYGLKHDVRHLGRHAGFRLGRRQPTSSSSSAPIRPTAIRSSPRA